MHHDVESQVQKVVDRAVRDNVVIQAIDAKALEPFMGRASPVRRPLAELSQGSGGHLFENTNDLTGAMEHAANPEVDYLLAFNPGRRDGKFHTLKIRFTAKRPDSIEFRPSYFSDDSEKPSAHAALDQAVFSKQSLYDVSAAVALASGQAKDGEVPVSIRITVNVNRLSFAGADGRHRQQLVFLTALLDSAGGFVTGKESVMDLSLTDAKLASMRKDGLTAVATLAAPPGSYQLRAIVREGVKGSLAASSTAVALRQ